MSHIIQNFGNWKKINENDVPGRERERGDDHNKVVAIPVDKNTLKLKIVNDLDVIDNNDKLTVKGFDAILNWIKGQREIFNYYSALGDLANNIVIYAVQKDNSRKQVVIFKIYNKTELKSQQDPSAAGISPQVRFIRQDELKAALGGTILNANAPLGKVGQPDGSAQLPVAATFNFPVKAATIPDNTDPRIIDFIRVSYNKLKKDPIVSAHPISAKIKADVKAAKLSASSALFVKAMNAGFGILDAEFKEDTETDITKILYDKIMSLAESKSVYLGLDAQRIVEALSTVIPAFDIDAFIAIASQQAVVDTGGIKVPPAGFKEGMQNDPELKKFQDLLKKKLARNLANHSTYQKFVAAGARGYQGNYGPLTKDLIYLLKAIADNPQYPNRDGSTIEPEFVNLVQKINESTGSSYLGLDGMTFIYEDFNFGQANVVVPSAPISSNRGSQNRSSADQNLRRDQEQVNRGGSIKYQLQDTAPAGYDYLIKDGVWYSRKGNTVKLLTNPDSIKALYKKYSNAGGYFIKTMLSGGNWVRANKNLYKPKNGIWYVKLNGSNNWEKVTNDGDIIRLKDMYKDIGPATYSKEEENKINSVTEIDKTHREIAKSLDRLFLSDAFSDYKSSNTATFFTAGIVSDKEDEAWKEFSRRWNTGEKSIKNRLNKTKKGIANLPKGDAKARCEKNQETLEGIIKTDGTFYKKFHGGTSDDKFTIKLYQADGGVFRRTIDTDI